MLNRKDAANTTPTSHAVVHPKRPIAGNHISDDMLRLIADSSVDAIVAADEDGCITLWNLTAQTVFGRREAEVIGESLVDTILPTDLRRPISDGLKNYLSTGAEDVVERPLELSGIAKDGREFPIELVITAHKSGEGQTFVAFVRDITEQKKQHDRARQSHKMEAIGILAGGIAHDFNNILASIAGNVVLAKTDVTMSKDAKECLSEIEKAAVRAAYVVRQILTFSAVGEAKTSIVNLAETIDDALKLLQATLPASTEITTHYEPDLPPILADKTDIHQIILNLGINADQAMVGRGGKFEINLSRSTLDMATAQSLNVEAGDFVHLSARDSGSGMSPTTLGRVFEPFFTTKATGQGTGLGLAVVYGIVSRQHGSITVSSEEGSGTIFHIYFPVAGAIPKGMEPRAKSAEAIPGNGERILYVDDDEALVFMMTRLLRRLNYEVVSFQHSRQALEAFRSDPGGFDVVITDMSMPEIDGAALVHELRAIRPDLPIVMVTGYIRPADLEQALSLGISELILKPNTADEMGEVLNNIITETLNKKRVKVVH